MNGLMLKYRLLSHFVLKEGNVFTRTKIKYFAKIQQNSVLEVLVEDTV